MTLDSSDDQSILVQEMAWCRQATSHYLSQCWPTSLTPYGVPRPQWVIYQHLEMSQDLDVHFGWCRVQDYKKSLIEKFSKEMSNFNFSFMPNGLALLGAGVSADTVISKFVNLTHWPLGDLTKILENEISDAGFKYHMPCFFKSPRYTGGDFMFLYRFVRHSRSRRRPQILVHAITFEQLFGFL